VGRHWYHSKFEPSQSCAAIANVFGQFIELVLFNWLKTGFSILGAKKGAYVLMWLALPKKVSTQVLPRGTAISHITMKFLCNHFFLFIRPCRYMAVTIRLRGYRSKGVYVPVHAQYPFNTCESQFMFSMPDLQLWLIVFMHVLCREGAPRY
jgi:hypothetical protein